MVIAHVSRYRRRTIKESRDEAKTFEEGKTKNDVDDASYAHTDIVHVQHDEKKYDKPI